MNVHLFRVVFLAIGWALVAFSPVSAQVLNPVTPIVGGIPTSTTNPLATGITDGTNGPAAVKPASTPPVTTDKSLVVGQNPNSVPASKHLVSSMLTKIAVAGTYTSATTTAPEAICLAANTTACAPMTTTVSSVSTASGFLTSVSLVKSTTGATAATFRVYAYQTAPTLTSVYDTTTYTPLLVDIQSGAYLGSWECATQTVNSNNSRYDCSSNTPIGYQQFNLADGILRFVPVATGAYVSGSSETFNIISDTSVSMP